MSLPIQAGPDWGKKNGKHPAGIVLAFEEAHTTGEVILYGPWRVMIQKELTREQAMQQLLENGTRPNRVAGTGMVEGAKIDVTTVKDVEAPGPEYTHFYSARVI